METYTCFHASPLGQLKIQCTDTHVQAIVFTDDKESPDQAASHALLQQVVTELDEYFEGKRKAFELPLSQPGTDFQRKIWELLYGIPFGKTFSYQQLAKQYGDPKAIRAVASANGRNNLAIVVPCHRVIGSDQSLTGYAGGLWRKKWLLEHEAKHSGSMQMEIFR